MRCCTASVPITLTLKREGHDGRDVRKVIRRNGGSFTAGGFGFSAGSVRGRGFGSVLGAQRPSCGCVFLSVRGCGFGKGTAVRGCGFGSVRGCDYG